MLAYFGQQRASNLIFNVIFTNLLFSDETMYITIKTKLNKEFNKLYFSRHASRRKICQNIGNFVEKNYIITTAYHCVK